MLEPSELDAARARRRRARRVVHAALRPPRPGTARARPRARVRAARRHDLRAHDGRGDRPRARALRGRHRARGLRACARPRPTPSQQPGERRRFMPLYSLMVATEPLPPAVWDAIGWEGRETISDLRHLFFYAQRTPDDRIAIGGRGAPYRLGSPIDEAYERNDGVRARLVRTIADRFPAAAAAAITHHWGGPLGVPRDWCCSVHYDRRERLRLGRRLHGPRRRHEQRARPHARRSRAEARHGARLAAVGRARRARAGSPSRCASSPRARSSARSAAPIATRTRRIARRGERGSCARSCRFAETVRSPRRVVDGLPTAPLACRG